MNDFFKKNWALMTYGEKTAWLLMFGLGKKVVKRDGVYFYNDKPLSINDFDMNLIYQVERTVDRNLYMENILNEVSSITDQESANEFYEALVFASKHTRGVCLYYTLKNQNV